MRTARATGTVLDGMIEHAGELLTIVEEELDGLDRSKHATLFAAAPVLRLKLDRLRQDFAAG